MKKLKQLAEQLAYDWMNDEYIDAISTLQQLDRKGAITVAVLAYKEVQKASESVGVDPEKFVEFLAS